jgi:ribosome-binding ATPase
VGIEEPCEGRFVRAAYQLVDLVTFFTCNENELRAWQLKRYSTAIDAAGSVHSDMARGFIRAEVIAVEDLKKLGSVKDVRTHGKERLEGKTGPVMDGDLIHFRFSV